MSDANTASGPPPMSSSMKAFVAFLIVATGALCVLVLLLSRENRSLKEKLAMQTAARVEADGLKAGEQVTPITMISASGAPTELAFGADEAPVMLFVMSTACGPCEQTLPIWSAAVEASGDTGVRIVCVQTDAQSPATMKATPPTMPSFTVPAGASTWLRRIPVVPAAVIIDGDGRVVRAWWGQLNPSQSDELRDGILAAAAGT